MEWLTGKEQLTGYIKKYRYVLLILLLGIFLMALPEGDVPVEEEGTDIASEPDLEESLASILSKVSGAGKVEVLLTPAKGAYTVYQTDEDISSQDVRRNTVVITNVDREETGLIVQINPPVYLGAIILCQGADNANVRLSIVEAVKSVTGLTSDCITVLKMK